MTPSPPEDEVRGCLSAIATGCSLMLTGVVFHFILRDLPTELSLPLTLIIAVAATALLSNLFNFLLENLQKRKVQASCLDDDDKNGG